MGMVYPLTGIDASVMLKHRVKNAAQVIPVAITGGFLANAAMSILITVGIAYTYTTDNIATAIISSEVNPADRDSNGKLGRPMQYSLGLASLFGYCSLCAAFVALVAACQHTVALARNRVIPYHHIFLWHWKWSTYRVFTVLPALILCLPLVFVGFGSAVVLRNLIGITISMSYSAHLISLCSMIYYRLFAKVAVPMGPWKLWPRWALLINIIAAAFAVFCLTFSMFPAASHDSRAVRNYTPAVLVGVVVVSSVWYRLYQGAHYRGPARV